MKNALTTAAKLLADPAATAQVVDALAAGRVLFALAALALLITRR